MNSQRQRARCGRGPVTANTAQTQLLRPAAADPPTHKRAGRIKLYQVFLAARLIPPGPGFVQPTPGRTVIGASSFMLSPQKEVRANSGSGLDKSNEQIKENPPKLYRNPLEDSHSAFPCFWSAQPFFPCRILSSTHDENRFPHSRRNEELNGLFHSYQPPASCCFLCCESSPLFCSSECVCGGGGPRSSACLSSLPLG